MFPHAEHLFRACTSLSALPAICRIRFLECEVLFLGTARRIPSKSPGKSCGRLRPIDIGMARALVVAGKNERKAMKTREGAVDAAGMKIAAMVAAEKTRRGGGPRDAGGEIWRAGVGGGQEEAARGGGGVRV